MNHPVKMHVSALADIGQNVVESITEAQLSGCAACLRKSDDYVVVVGSVFDIRKSEEIRFEFSALCGECFKSALAFGKAKRG